MTLFPAAAFSLHTFTRDFGESRFTILLVYFTLAAAGSASTPIWRTFGDVTLSCGARNGRNPDTRPSRAASSYQFGDTIEFFPLPLSPPVRPPN